MTAQASQKADPSPHGVLDVACSECHTVEGWKPLREPLPFDHGATSFKLGGAHSGPACRTCHPTLKFAEAGGDCVSCHQGEFAQARNPVHSGFPTACLDCHGDVAWRPAVFSHDQTAFRLSGAHRSASCLDCHARGYAGTPTDCLSCHQVDFDGAIDPPHAGFPSTCVDCHSDAAWQPARFDHNQTAFQLMGAHRTAACQDCHARGYAGTPTDCFSCHQSDFNGAADPAHTGFPTACQDCHGQSAWQPASFDHNQTAFRLNGAHRTATCQDCHTRGYAGTPTDCFSCHQSDFNGAADPAHTGFPTACQDCHGEAAWQPASFDHNQTAFRLNGAHRTATCQDCHARGYAGTPTDCFSCHQSDFNGAADPAHTGFPTACQDCHGEAAWQPASFDHNQTAFRLNGAHRTAACQDCHARGYAGTPTDCFSCHQSDFNGAADPAHTGFPTACQNCHGEVAWQPASFDHNQTAFRLNGAHRTAACQDCHARGYAGTPTDCFSCHQSDFNGAADPAHTGFPTACQNCHGEAAWQPASFDHNQTAFRLNGAHRTAACQDCHARGYAGTPTDCFSCHQSDFNGAADPAHTGFPTACQNCHGEAAWQPASFDHGQTSFPLNGAHRSAACLDCHARGYSGTPNDCFSCHQSDFNGAQSPSHTGFPHTCQNCHSESAWQPASFDHNQTDFPLSGAHRTAACLDCHTRGYAGTPTDCFSCHQADFNGAHDPPHTGFPHTCQNCHSTNGWEPASFNHAQTSFPLRGAHQAAACLDCHSQGYDGTPTDCYSCHLADFNGTNDPPHTGFPHTCQNCHTESSWEPASFNHDQTSFPLTGAHRTTACLECHTSGYNGTPTDCYSCHQNDFAGTDDPSHTGFPHACETCHSTTAWVPSSFNHEPLFPIASGPHHLACSECHVNSGNFATFECILCHEHRQSEANDEHEGVPGYVWQSQSCYQCHPRGRE